MAKVVITGAEQIRKNIKLAEDGIKRNVLAGMTKAAITVQRDMEERWPLTPVEFSFLRHSFFITTILSNRRPNRLLTSKAKEGRKPKPNQAIDVEKDTKAAMDAAKAIVTTARNLTLIMGYGANYAIWVHEMEQKTHINEEGDTVNNWTRPGSAPKWFEEALKRNKGKILALIGKEATITTTKGFTRTKTMEARTDIEEI